MNNLQKLKLIHIKQSNDKKKLLFSNQYKNSFNRPVIGQCCAALFNGDWYRARILEIEENRVRVQYIDW